MMNERELARKIVMKLDEGAQSIDGATLARLAAGRQRAVAGMRPTDAVAAAWLQPVFTGWGRVVEFSHHGGSHFWLPLLVLLAVLAAVVSSSLNTGGNAPIDADALLLASDLPPEAYADKDFVAWLEHSS